MTKTSRVLGGIAVASLVLVAGLTAPAIAASEPTAEPLVQNPRGKFLGVMPSRPSAPLTPDTQPNAGPHAVSQVTYHGGPVQHSSAVYAIFWRPAAIPFPANYATTIGRYFVDVAHDSFTAGNPYGADVQYFSGAGSAKKWVSYAVTYRGAFVDTRPYPSNGCPNYLLNDGTMSKKCLNNTQVVNQIKSFIAARGLPKGIGIQYFLFTPKGVAGCFTSGGLASGGCYDPMNYPGYCAYHSFSGAGAQAVIFANMPFANITGCSSGQSPQNNAADSTINGISHEHQETMTDPLGTGWFDVDGNEIADKCVFNYGAPLGSNAYGQYNQVINGRKYWLQQIWSNRAQACVQRNTYPQPTASFTFSPASPAKGTPVSFHSTSHSGDGTPLTYRWLFPNGVTKTVAHPSFTFAAAGPKNITLIVADAHGSQKKVTRVITVH